MDDRLMTLPEIAKMTGLSIDTLRWYRHLSSAENAEKQVGPETFRMGRRVVARESNVLAWIADMEKRGKSPDAA